MPSCKQVSHMVSESLDGKALRWHERIKVKIHLSMCLACRRMVRQMKLLRAAAGEFGKSDQNAVHTKQETLSPEASERIRAHLRQAQQDAADDV